MPCGHCGKKRNSKPVASLRSTSTTSPTFTYTPPRGAPTPNLTRPQAENLRSSNGGQGRITPQR